MIDKIKLIIFNLDNAYNLLEQIEKKPDMPTSIDEMQLQLAGMINILENEYDTEIEIIKSDRAENELESAIEATNERG